MGNKRDLLPKYEAVVRVVNALCRAQKGPWMDDVASKCLVNLWKIGGFEWDMLHIKNFVRREIRWQLWADAKSPTRCVSDLTEEDPTSYFEELCGSKWGEQENVVEAWFARRLMVVLEPRERLAVLILADGGSPLDVANELGTDPVGAMLLIKRARRKARDAVQKGEPDERRNDSDQNEDAGGCEARYERAIRAGQIRRR